MEVLEVKLGMLVSSSCTDRSQDSKYCYNKKPQWCKYIICKYIILYVSIIIFYVSILRSNRRNK